MANYSETNVIIKDFKTYWEEKAQKRRKSWASKAKRYADKHTGIYDIKKDVFLPIDYVDGFDLDDYKPTHYIGRNPIAVWKQGQFEFSERSLREAMVSYGADMTSFKMKVEHQSIIGKNAPEPNVSDYGIENFPNKVFRIEKLPNKVFYIEDRYRAWLKRIYEICTEVEICKLNYGQVSMIIRRYSTEGIPFAYYELIPCVQLVKSAMLIEETSFYTLNTATLLMEMASEYELRQEEEIYFAKKLKLRQMEAVTIDKIDFNLWEDKKLGIKLREYANSNKTCDEVLAAVLQPWKKGVRKFLDAMTECDKTGPFIERTLYMRMDLISGGLLKYMNDNGMNVVKVDIPSYSDTIMEYKGYRAFIYTEFVTWKFYFCLYADKDESIEWLKSKNIMSIELKKISYSAIAEYMKQMPSFIPTIEAFKDKVKQEYERLTNLK